MMRLTLKAAMLAIKDAMGSVFPFWYLGSAPAMFISITQRRLRPIPTGGIRMGGTGAFGTRGGIQSGLAPILPESLGLVKPGTPTEMAGVREGRPVPS
jgi:hypothetical protein